MNSKRGVFARNFWISIVVLLAGFTAFYTGFTNGLVALVIILSTFSAMMYGVFWLMDYDPKEDGAEVFKNLSQGMANGLKNQKD